MNLRTGYRLFSVRERQRAGDFQHPLRLLHGCYWGRHGAPLLDEDPSHTAAGSQGLAESLGIELLWLPKRCPKLNPMDQLWGHAKDEVCGNRQYGSIDEQVDRFLRHLYGLSPGDALQKPGVHSEGFWLKSALRILFCRPA